MSKELSLSQSAQYVGPYRLEKTLGKGQTGKNIYPLQYKTDSFLCSCLNQNDLCCFSTFRAGQTWHPLYYGSEGSDQNSQP